MNADSAAVLFGSLRLVREAIIVVNVIKLCGRLVVPGTPRLGAVNGHNRALVAADDHAVWIVRINPELMIIIAARRAFDRGPLLAAISRSIDGRVRHVNGISVLRIGGDFLEVPAAIPQSFIAGKPGPGCARIFLVEDAALLRIDGGINPIVINRRDRDADPSAPFDRNSLIDFIPRRAAVSRFEDTAARAIRRRIDEPWRSPHVPQRRVNDLRVGWIEVEIDRAYVVILE